MPRRRTRKSKSLAVEAVKLGVAVPQVMAHRIVRLGDRKEFYRMGAEKIVAFNEAWTAMAFEAFRANQRLALSFLQSPWFPQLTDAALGVLGKGMAPVRRRAVANAKRLGRPRRRR